VVFVASVPSRVTTVVMCSISMLFPAISSIAIVFHLPVVSACQAMWQLEPSLKVSLGAGASGVTDARAGAATKSVRMAAANISFSRFVVREKS